MQWLSGQSSAADTKVTQTWLHCSYIEVIATKVYSRVHELGGRYKISIEIFFFTITNKTFTEFDYMSNLADVL